MSSSTLIGADRYNNEDRDVTSCQQQSKPLHLKNEYIHIQCFIFDILFVMLFGCISVVTQQRHKLHSTTSLNSAFSLQCNSFLSFTALFRLISKRYSCPICFISSPWKHFQPFCYLVLQIPNSDVTYGSLLSVWVHDNL